MSLSDGPYYHQVTAKVWQSGNNGYNDERDVTFRSSTSSHFREKGRCLFPIRHSFGLLFLLFYSQLFHKFSNQEVTFSGETNGKKFGVFFFLGNGQPKSSFMRNHQSETTPPSNWIWFFFFFLLRCIDEDFETIAKGTICTFEIFPSMGFKFQKNSLATIIFKMEHKKLFDRSTKFWLWKYP